MMMIMMIRGFALWLLMAWRVRSIFPSAHILEERKGMWCVRR